MSKFEKIIVWVFGISLIYWVIWISFKNLFH